MIVLVTGAKGGVGATVVAAAIGLAPDPAGAPAVMVDLTADLQAAMGGSGRPRVGVGAWLASDAAVGRLDDLRHPTAVPGAELLAWGETPTTDATLDAARWTLLLAWCRQRSESGDVVVIDAGCHGPAMRRAALAALGAAPGGQADLDEVLVTRQCYLALRRARAALHTDDRHDPHGMDGARRAVGGVVVVSEPGRAFGRHDVERSLGLPVIATMRWDPAVATAVDAGLDTVGLPRSMRRAGQTVRRRLCSADRLRAATT